MLKINPEHIDQQFHPGMEILSETGLFQLDTDGITITCRHEKECKTGISLSNHGIEIFWNSPNDFYRQLSRILMYSSPDTISHLAITEKKQFTLSGVMIDCSRNGVLNIPYAKELIRAFALMGINSLMLYIEDLYEIPSEPYFGYMRGRYSRDELRELDAYAGAFGIELVPCIQTLAHLNQFLQWEIPKQKYHDIDDILLVDTDECYSLIDRMFSSLSASFQSRRIHIGMDEAAHVGRGNYLAKAEYTPRKAIILKHLERVLEIAEKYSYKTIIWDDMFFNGDPKNEGLKLPDNTSFMYWDYYSNEEEHYTENLKRRKEKTKHIMFATGAWRWIGYTPHHSKTLKTVDASLSACKKEDIREAIITAWADDGCESPVSTLLLGAAYFAEHAYSATVNTEEFKLRLFLSSGTQYDDFMLQEQLDILPFMQEQANIANISKYTFYEDPLCSLFTKHVDTGALILPDYYRRLSEEFSKSALRQQKEGIGRLTAEFYCAYARVLEHKARLAKDLYEAYQAGDRIALKQIQERDLEALPELIAEMRTRRKRVWEYCNKASGFEVLDMRFGSLIQRVKTCTETIDRYCKGELEVIEQLDEKRLPAVSDDNEWINDSLIHFNQALNAMTANKLSWGP